MKLLGSTNTKVTKDKNSENLSRLGVTEVVLIYFNIVNSYYQQDSRALYTFAPDKSFGELLKKIIEKFYIFKNLSFKVFVY